MLTLIRYGGFPMWFILGFGLIGLGAAILNALAPAPRRLAFARELARATLFATLAGTAADLGTTCLSIARSEAIRADPQWPFVVLQGCGESMCPGIIGFTLVSLTALLVAVARNCVPPSAA